ncbi:MAG: hypothetical protein ACYDAI_11055 [Trichloromonadaceae bacterium]
MLDFNQAERQTPEPPKLSVAPPRQQTGARKITRADLVGIRQACMCFLLVFEWNRNAEEINDQAALSNLRQIRDELDRLSLRLKRGGA